MSQDKISGAKGNEYGHQTARKIAKSINAEMIGTVSNEAIYCGERVVIKCAGKKTTSVGVTFSMQANIKRVVAAFEQDDGQYKVYSLDISLFQSRQRQSQSKPNGAHRVGQVARGVFTSHGALVGTFSISCSAA